MSKTLITEHDIFTLIHARRVADDPELDGIYARSGAQASQFRKLVRLGLIEFTDMGETDDERHLPVALYSITDAGKRLLQERAKPITPDEVKRALAAGAKESALARRTQKRSPRR